MLSIIFKPLKMPAVAKIVTAQALHKSPNMESDSKIGQLNHKTNLSAAHLYWMSKSMLMGSMERTAIATCG